MKLKEIGYLVLLLQVVFAAIAAIFVGSGLNGQFSLHNDGSVHFTPLGTGLIDAGISTLLVVVVTGVMIWGEIAANGASWHSYHLRGLRIGMGGFLVLCWTVGTFALFVPGTVEWFIDGIAAWFYTVTVLPLSIFVGTKKRRLTRTAGELIEAEKALNRLGVSH